MPQRRTKIIATLGPATDADDVLHDLIEAGVDIIRLNFSHGSASDHLNRASRAREIAKSFNREISVLADLQGPKLRIARFKNKSVTLVEDQEFTLDAALGNDDGDEKHVGIDYKQLVDDVSAGDVLLLADGAIELVVKDVSGSKILCVVRIGGELSNNKGVNRLGGGLSAKALTEKDRADLQTALSMAVDFIAISFPRSADDIHEARQIIKNLGGDVGLIAKIERREAIDCIDEIILASDGVMVARGDLGVEIGDEFVPSMQKRIIHRARALNRAVITATQMMESMIHQAIPTRAEVSDVANAVLDGTDAVMLSAETASGDHPVKVVQAMDRICRAAESNPSTQISRHRVECEFQQVDEAIAMATMYTANHLNIKAIIALTESGTTPRWMSRIRSGIPIYGLSRNMSTLRRMNIYRGVHPIDFDPTTIDRRAVNRRAVDRLLDLGRIETGDLVIITKGDSMGSLGGTNAMKILRVGEVN